MSYLSSLVIRLLFHNLFRKFPIYLVTNRVDGLVDVDGYYCYAFEFFEVEFFQEPEPTKTDPPTPTPMADIALDLTCTFEHAGKTILCDSLAFAQYPFNTCSAEVTYNYEIINNSYAPVRLNALLDESLVSILPKSVIIEGNSIMNIQQIGSLDLCQSGGTSILKQGLAIASPVRGGPAAQARDTLKVDIP